MIHELLKVETYTSLGDLAESVKRRCAKLHIPYDGGLISEALASVARTRPLLTETRRQTYTEHASPDRAISRAEASAICQRLQVSGRAISERGAR